MFSGRKNGERKIGYIGQKIRETDKETRRVGTFALRLESIELITFSAKLARCDTAGRGDMAAVVELRMQLW